MSEAQPDDPYPETETQHYVLRLFVTGTTPRSMRAIENLRRICEEYLAGRYTLEVVDIYQDPESARDHQIIAAPTLVKLLPEPVRRVIGDLGDLERVLQGLAVVRAPSDPTDDGPEASA